MYASPESVISHRGSGGPEIVQLPTRGIGNAGAIRSRPVAHSTVLRNQTPNLAVKSDVPLTLALGVLMALYQLTLFYPSLKAHANTVRNIRADVEAIAGKNWRVLSAGEQVCAIALESDSVESLVYGAGLGAVKQITIFCLDLIRAFHVSRAVPASRAVRKLVSRAAARFLRPILDEAKRDGLLRDFRQRRRSFGASQCGG